MPINLDTNSRKQRCITLVRPGSLNLGQFRKYLLTLRGMSERTLLHIKKERHVDMCKKKCYPTAE